MAFTTPDIHHTRHFKYSLLTLSPFVFLISLGYTFLRHGVVNVLCGVSLVNVEQLLFVMKILLSAQW